MVERIPTLRTRCIAAGFGIVVGACVDRAIELPLHQVLSVEEVCEVYCEMESTCPNSFSSSSDCYEVCVDPWRTWPEMSEDCAHARFLKHACFVELGCEGLPGLDSDVEVCTDEEVAPDYDYTPEDCGFTVLDGDGG